jgi:hypothetical protein
MVQQVTDHGLHGQLLMIAVLRLKNVPQMMLLMQIVTTNQLVLVNALA